MARRVGPRRRSVNGAYIVAGVFAAVLVIGALYRLDLVGGGGSGGPVETNDVNVAEVSIPAMGEVNVAQVGPAVAVEPNIGGGERRGEPNVPADAGAAALIAEAMTLINAGGERIIQARDKLNDALRMNLSPRQRAVVKAQLRRLSEQWLFSKTFFAGDRLCGSYLVQPGDLLSTIGKRFKVPYELLMEINKISRPEALRAGVRIKVVNGPFHLKVYRSSFTMDVYLRDTYVTSFPVGLGEPGRQTPVGLWRIKAGGKIPQPVYTDPDTGEVIHPEDPEYPLGSRWMELEGMDENTRDKKGFGIHGTKEPESIGRASSRGCIRLHNGDAIRVYNLVVPVDSTVEVIE